MITLAGGYAGHRLRLGAPRTSRSRIWWLADPEVIVLGDAAYGTTPEIVAKRPGWGT